MDLCCASQLDLRDGAVGGADLMRRFAVASGDTLPMLARVGDKSIELVVHATGSGGVAAILGTPDAASATRRTPWRATAV